MIHAGGTVPLSESARTIDVRRPISTLQMFAMALPQAARKAQGKLAGTTPPVRQRAVQRGLRLDPRRIAAWREVCAYDALPGRVPLPYPETHFTPLMAEVIVSSAFPFSPLGLIHLRQTLVEHATLQPGDVVDLEAETSELRDTERGYELDFTLTATHRGERAWSGVTTLLTRGPSARAPRRAGTDAPTPRPTPGALEIAVPAGTGVAYARVSGDWNPHHLHWLTSRPLGYRRPIAHGMWTFARALAESLRGRDLGDAALRAVATFKKPVLMPGRIRIEAPSLTADGTPCPILVTDPTKGSPHLLGECEVARP